jgi:hypothetical protein
VEIYQMSENPFENFNSGKDYVNWDRYEEQVDKIDLSPSDRQRVRSGLQYFRAVLGEDFLKDTLRTAHPFSAIFTNVAPRERIFLAELAEQMKALETAEKFQDLKERIRSRDPETSAEAMSVLEIARKFYSAEFSISFEPEVYVSQRSGEKRAKFPDIKISDASSSQVIFVEVSRLLVGERQRKSSRTFRALFNIWDGLTWRYRDEIEKDLPIGKGILPNIKFYRPMDEKELETIAKMLYELGSLVLRTRSFSKLSIEGLIDVGIAPPDDHEAVHKWAKANELEHPPVGGPLIETDEVERAIRKIFADDDKTAKKWQIPDDGPGIVVLDTNKNLMLFTHDTRYVIGALEQAILNEPKLNYIIMTLTYTGFESANSIVSEISNHTVVRNSKADGSVECAVMIRNERCKTPLSAETEKSLIRAFGS